MIQIDSAFWQISRHGSQRSRQDRTGKKQAHLRHSTTLLLENTGFLKAQGTIYPLRLYRFYHDANKQLGFRRICQPPSRWVRRLDQATECSGLSSSWLIFRSWLDVRLAGEVVSHLNLQILSSSPISAGSLQFFPPARPSQIDFSHPCSKSASGLISCTSKVSAA